MKKTNMKPLESKVALAVRAALLSMLALPAISMASDISDEVVELTSPANVIEVGAQYVGNKSAKFGEYNGLNKENVYGIANFDLRGGNAYSKDGGDGVTRWSFEGSDLGTTNRTLGASYEQQGSWNIGFGFDQMRHYTSGTYQTPLQGSMGSNSFTLPSSFGVIQGSLATGAISGAQFSDAQKAMFQTQEIYTQRENLSFKAGYNVDRQWTLQFAFNRLEQTGAKLMSTDTQAGLANSFSAGSQYSGQKIMMLMNPTNYTTDTFNLGVNWVGEKAHANLSYYGSFFQDGYSSVSWSNPWVSGANGMVPCNGTCYPMNMISTAPNNDFHQIKFVGGYEIAPKTKLVGGFSYGQNTQNDQFLNNLMQVGGLPRTSLDGKVITTNANLKLTDRSIKDLTLSAAIRYDERDNQTSSANYAFQTVGTTLGNVATFNTPYSNNKTAVLLDANYRLTKGQDIGLAYSHERIKRWCNPTIGRATGTGAVAGTNLTCVESTGSREDKITASYRLKVNEALGLKTSYSYADRVANDYSSSVAVLGTGNANVPGFVSYFDASRVQQAVKAGVNWDVFSDFTVSLNGRYIENEYRDNSLGIKRSTATGGNVDLTYTFGEVATASVYYDIQSNFRTMSNAANVAATQIWDNRLHDVNQGVGMNVKHTGFFGGRLELVGDAAWSIGKTGYSTSVPYATCSTSATLTCGDVPDISTKLFQFKLIGAYNIDKQNRVALTYLYQHLKDTDYYYNAYQMGYTPTSLLPTNEQAPSYNVNVLALTYGHSF